MPLGAIFLGAAIFGTASLGAAILDVDTRLRPNRVGRLFPREGGILTLIATGPRAPVDERTRA